MRLRRGWQAGPALVACWPAAGRAAEVDGAALSAAWALPFAGLLLSIALLPLLRPAFWHRRFGLVTAAWAAAFLLPFTWAFGPSVAAGTLLHTLLAEYVPFVVLLTALFTAAGGIHVHIDLPASPRLNVGLMAVGAALASVMGTTGASVLLIRPLIRANAGRRHSAHVVVFFIFIVGNAGGSLTPLGDPPLFLGFLHGVDFFWTARHLGLQTLFLVGALLAVFFVVDHHRTRRDGPGHGAGQPAAPPARRQVRVDGLINLLPLAAVAALVLMSGLWKPGIAFGVAGTTVPLPALLRDGGLIAVTALSLAVTPAGVRAANAFSWAPMQEVAKLFAGIFLTMAPVLAMLQAGAAGPFGALTRAVTGADGQPLPAAYFWFSGSLSALLDNAPTYLVFFNLAGGHAPTLMTAHAATLAAISAGAVFMGAVTYIGNAPNFIVKAIAEDRGIRMPSFFGYLLWSGVVLLPLFGLMTMIWFH